MHPLKTVLTTIAESTRVIIKVFIVKPRWLINRFQKYSFPAIILEMLAGLVHEGSDFRFSPRLDA